MKFTTALPFTADAANVYICDIKKPNDLTEWFGNIFVYGTAGVFGTMTLSISPDGGTTKVPLLNTSGTAISFTAAAMASARLGDGGTLSDHLKLYATLAGSTTPNLNVAVFDNR